MPGPVACTGGCADSRPMEGRRRPWSLDVDSGRGSTPAKARGGRREATTEPLTDARTGRLSAITPEP